MKKRSRKLISILLTLSLLVTLLVPLAAPAAASSGTISALTTPTVADTIEQTLGAIKVSVPAGSITSGDSVIFKIPDGYDFGSAFNTTVQTASTTGNYVFVPGTYNGTDANGLDDANFAVTVLDANDEVQISYNGADQSAVSEGVFYIYLKDVDVEEDTTDDCVVNFDGPAGSGFPSGTVTVAKTASDGNLSVSVSGADTSNNVFNFDLRVKEDVIESLKVDDESIKLVLPDGYEWETGTDPAGDPIGEYSRLWGDTLGVTIDTNDNGDELLVDFAGPLTGTTSAFELKNLRFTVSDESKVKAGDIVVKVKGESDSTPTTLTVGTYGDYNAGITAKDTPTVYAGKTEQEVGDLVIKEEIAQSLVDGRYITLTLPSYVRWTTVPDEVSDEGVTLTFAGVSGTDGNKIKYDIANNGTGDPAELKFEDMEILLDVCAPGDLNVQLGGTSGLEGEVAFAKIENAVTVASDSKPEVKIGMAAQKIGDITITETEAGAIEEGTLTIKVPNGCEFAKLPKVEVTAGDIGLDLGQMARAKVKNDFYQYINIPVDNDSNDVSTIKISDIYVTVDRTVAEGDLKVAVLGSAVLESNGNINAEWFNAVEGAGSVMRADIDGDTNGDYDAPAGSAASPTSLFPATAALTAVAAATVNTPAPGETKANASFVIGSTTYKVAGVEMTMDVAPYVKDGRTFLPVRYVAQTLGVADANILWDAASQKVTLIKNGTVVQLTIGSKVMLLNGAAITMDVAPELTSDRTMLPIRFIAQAFGATVGWDEATQTVTIN